MNDLAAREPPYGGARAAFPDGAAAGRPGAISGAAPAGSAAPDRSPSGDGDRKQYLEHLKKVNDVFYDQIKIADQKAAYIFTFMVAFLITSAEGRSVFRLQRYQNGDWLLIALSLLLAAAAVVCVVSAILVVLPRHRGGRSSSLYWGAWTSQRDGFVAAEQAADSDYLRDEYLANIDNLAMINRAKYRSVKVAFRALLVLVISYVLILGYGVGATALTG